MYKCTRCGEVFSEPYYRDWLEHHGEGMYEPYSEALCPECGSDDIEKAEACLSCGEYFTDDELYSGYCDDCVREALEADSFFRFAVDGATETKFSDFEDFMFRKVFRIRAENLPKASSFEMRDCLKSYYDEIATNDNFKDLALEYIRENYTLWEFAEWYDADRKEVS